VIGFDAVARELERGQGLGLAECRRRIDLGHADAHRDLIEIEPVEFQGHLQYSPVAIGLHLGDDIAHARFHVLRGLALGGEQSAETLGKIGAFLIQSQRHYSVPAGRHARITGQWVMRRFASTLLI
jgi:hypothetical protein